MYAAGKIAKNDWRGTSSDCDSVTQWRDVVRWHDRHPWWPDPATGLRIVYAGPFFVRCDHGCYHGPGSHGAGGDMVPCPDDPPPRSEVASACLRQVAGADVVYVRLDHREAFGTLVEVGYAAALGKPIVLDVVPGFDTSDFWFVQELARQHRAPLLVANAVRACFPLSAGPRWQRP